MGLSDGRTRSRGTPWRSVVLLALMAALFLAHRAVRPYPVQPRDRARSTPLPRPQTIPFRLPEIIDESVRVQSKPPTPPAVRMIGGVPDFHAVLGDTPEARVGYQQGVGEEDPLPVPPQAGLQAR